MRYQGGKSKIARQIVQAIRQYCDASTIYEPFCGGCAVTEELLKAGLTIRASDCHEDLILMWQSIVRGETTTFASVSEEEHRSLKDAAPSARRGFVGFAASFGGSFFGGFARNKCRTSQPHDEAARACVRLASLAAGRLTFERCDYRQIPDDATAYCDPPYAGTSGYSHKFDHEGFWSWVASRRGPTFVSELSSPLGLEIIWSKDYAPVGSNAKTLTRVEKLYFKP